MHKTNFKTKKIEVIPAILVKTRQELLDSINKVKKYVKTVHIDIMDNKFVPNYTIGLEEIKNLPKGVDYEFHWMVENPEQWINKIKENYLHLIHIETIKNSKIIEKFVKTKKQFGLAVNPKTDLKLILPYIKYASCVLIMSVEPGFSGQKYIKKAEEKVSFLKNNFPKLSIEVDGGITNKTALSAVKAGANKIAAASTIFNSKNIEQAIRELKESIRGKNAR